MIRSNPRWLFFAYARQPQMNRVFKKVPHWKLKVIGLDLRLIRAVHSCICKAESGAHWQALSRSQRYSVNSGGDKSQNFCKLLAPASSQWLTNVVWTNLAYISGRFIGYICDEENIFVWNAGQYQWKTLKYEKTYFKHIGLGVGVKKKLPFFQWMN